MLYNICMKKIAIVTITNSGLNFGNRLQNYALQRVLESFPASVQTIFSAKNMRNSLLMSKARKLAKAALKSTGRSRCFDSFDRAHIKKAKRTRYEHINDSSFSLEYDAFIAGSDQVWNPTFPFNSEFEFLTFAGPEKRHSYAASFGLDEIPEGYREAYSERLAGMRSISVREDKGREIVMQLAGRDAPVHVDPTMLLTADDYEAMEQKPALPLPEKYLLMYFLGNQEPEYIAFLREVADRLGLRVLELSENRNSAFYNMGPQHFLYILRHAEYICTDSFHGTVFAIIFQKPFTAFYRADENMSMHSRTETLLRKFNLSSRVFGVQSVEGALEGIPYMEVGELLARERAAALEYLRGIALQE